MRRYEKAAVAQKQLNLMSAEAVKFARPVELKLGNLVLKRCRPPRPPSALEPLTS